MTIMYRNFPHVSVDLHLQPRNDSERCRKAPMTFLLLFSWVALEPLTLPLPFFRII